MMTIEHLDPAQILPPSDLLAQLLDYIQRENLFRPGQDRLLLAVSGGIDSVVLSHLLKDAGLPFGIAHCNFNLRGDESLEDRHFVEQLAKALDVPFFATDFETEALARQHKSSLQMTARQLRYDWLLELLDKENFQYLATAHHLNDSIETLVLNLAKGCGIRGLHGILPKKGRVVRPLMFCSKEEIAQYAREKQIEYREDSSNYTEKYIRNQIRHRILPILAGLNPALEETFAENFERFREAEAMYDFGIEHFKRQICRWKDQGQLHIDAVGLRQCPAPLSLLFEILSPYGFNNYQVKELWQNSGRGHSGRIFQSETHKLLVDRGQYILQKIDEALELKSYVIKELKDQSIESPFGELRWRVYERQAEVEFAKNRFVAYFDATLLQFPLKLRAWQTGDMFQPFGMKGKHRKVSDFFNDLKLSRFEKERSPILESQGKILWIVGYRSDERFKVTADTQWIAEVEFLPSNVK